MDRLYQKAFVKKEMLADLFPHYHAKHKDITVILFSGKYSDHIYKIS